MVQIIIKDQQLDQYFDVNFKQLMQMNNGERISLTNDSFMVEFEVQKPFALKVTNAMDGYGQNCLQDFQNNEVQIKSSRTHQTDIWNEVLAQRDYQDNRFGIRTMDPTLWLPILGEEVGEVNKAVVEIVFEQADKQNLRDELIQVAAVAIAMIEDLDRQNFE